MDKRKNCCNYSNHSRFPSHCPTYRYHCNASKLNATVLTHAKVKASAKQLNVAKAKTCKGKGVMMMSQKCSKMNGSTTEPVATSSMIQQLLVQVAKFYC